MENTFLLVKPPSFWILLLQLQVTNTLIPGAGVSHFLSDISAPRVVVISWEAQQMAVVSCESAQPDRLSGWGSGLANERVRDGNFKVQALS